jgi:dihydrofolate reductase
MRKLIVTNIVSLDGYYEGPGANVMALPMDHAFDAYCAERLGTAETLLLGRNSFGLFSSFWPGVVNDPNATADQREISRRDNEIEKLVISDSLTAADTGAWRDTTRITRRADSHSAINERKAGSGGDILVFGSRTLWNDLLAAGLVDELHLIVGAVVLGGGTPAFPDGMTAQLQLLNTRTFEDSNNTVLRYATTTS